MESEKTLLAAFAGLETAHAFSAFCPSIFTIKSLANQTEQGKRDIRIGYLFAWIFALGLGLVISKIVKSWLPLMFSIVTAAFMTGVYEFSMISRGEENA